MRLILFVTILLYVMASSVFAAVDVGFFESVNGKVSVYHESSVRGQKVAEKDRIFTKDLIRTKRKAMAVVSLLGNSKVTLFQRTRMYVGNLAVGEVGSDIKTGRVLFDIDSADLKSEYKVKTPSMVIGVKGTSFMVEVINGATLVTVYEGIVDVKVAGRTIQLKQGDSVKSSEATESLIESVGSKTIVEDQEESSQHLEVLNNPTIKPQSTDIAREIQLNISIPK